MDAVEFLKAKNRMCREYGDIPEDCFACPIGNDSGGCQAGVLENQKVTEEILVQIVEKWAKEHPMKTRQAVFLELHPNAALDEDGVLNVYSCDIDKRIICYEVKTCEECRKDYWLGVEE